LILKVVSPFGVQEDPATGFTALGADQTQASPGASFCNDPGLTVALPDVLTFMEVKTDADPYDAQHKDKTQAASCLEVHWKGPLLNGWYDFGIGRIGSNVRILIAVLSISSALSGPDFLPPCPLSHTLRSSSMHFNMY